MHQIRWWGLPEFHARHSPFIIIPLLFIWWLIRTLYNQICGSPLLHSKWGIISTTNAPRLWRYITYYDDIVGNWAVSYGWHGISGISRTSFTGGSRRRELSLLIVRGCLRCEFWPLRVLNVDIVDRILLSIWFCFQEQLRFTSLDCRNCDVYLGIPQQARGALLIVTRDFGISCRH